MTGSQEVVGSSPIFSTLKIKHLRLKGVSAFSFCSTQSSTGTYIGKIENGKVIPIYKFDFKFYAHFNHQDKNGRQVLRRRERDSNLRRYSSPVQIS